MSRVRYGVTVMAKAMARKASGNSAGFRKGTKLNARRIAAKKAVKGVVKDPELLAALEGAVFAEALDRHVNASI